MDYRCKSILARLKSCDHPMGIAPFLISSVLLVSIAQRLVRRVCDYCKESYEPPKEALRYLGIDKSNNGNFKCGKGCLNCMNTGYKDRTGIYEVLLIDNKIQEMILNKNSATEITRMARKFGKFKSLRDNAIEKVLAGITTLEEATAAIMQ
jgi:type IV pilus assembly protein PilB